MSRRRHCAGRGASGVALAFAFAALVLTGGCGRRQPASIVWVVVDTLRADHLEWYGHSRTTSPQLGRLVEQGTLFEHAYTPFPETSPAMSSLLTGLYPPRHGVQGMYLRLHDANRTAAELLADAGYDTAAFVSSFVMIRDFSNLAQGFAVYDDFVTERELYRENYERRAAATVALARKWLQERRDDRPFFLFLHLIDPHGPYAPPGPWAERFRSAETVEVTAEIPGYQRIPGVTALDAYRDRYDGEIAYATAELGRLLDVLEQRHWLDDSVVVFTADHGESMGERGRYFQHGSDLHQENVHVPLIIKPPGAEGGGRRIATPVSLVDMLPTALELAGVPAPAGLDGRSLAALIRGASGAAVPVLMWSGRGDFAVAQGADKLLLRSGEAEHPVAVRFDLAGDRGEQRPAVVEPRVAAWLSQLEQRWRGVRREFQVESNFLAGPERGEFVRGRQRPDDAVDRERLRSLGYVD